MKIEANARQVTVFINSTDHYHATPLYQAIVQRCRERGIAGATVTRASATGRWGATSTSRRPTAPRAPTASGIIRRAR